MITIVKLIVYFLKYLFKKAPLLAGYKITYKCNLKCKHCPFWEKKKTEDKENIVNHVLKKLKNSGAEIIIFEGGEPTIWKDNNYTFKDILKKAKKYFLSVNFTTNGLNGFFYPADTIWVSIDGMQYCHDKIRGQGTFKKIMKNIKTFRQYSKVLTNRPKLYANICINSENYHEIPALICYLKNKVDGITIQFYYPYNNDFSLFLPVDKRIFILNKLIELKKSGFPISDSTSTLKALKRNTWKCRPQGLINAEPNGTINQGCYVKNRGEINCKYCGFAAHVELSKALGLKVSSIFTGLKVFFKKV